MHLLLGISWFRGSVDRLEFSLFLSFSPLSGRPSSARVLSVSLVSPFEIVISTYYQGFEHFSKPTKNYLTFVCTYVLGYYFWEYFNHKKGEINGYVISGLPTFGDLWYATNSQICTSLANLPVLMKLMTPELWILISLTQLTWCEIVITMAMMDFVRQCILLLCWHSVLMLCILPEKAASCMHSNTLTWW